MARQKSYSEQLKDPRWQRKRLAILERADFTCEQCGSKDSTLHVHHGYYEKGCKPWEYPDKSLHCLCENCHKREQQILSTVHKEIGLLTSDNLHRVLGYIQAMRMKEKIGEDFDYEKHSWCQGFSDFFGIDHHHVLVLIETTGQLSYQLITNLSKRL